MGVVGLVFPADGVNSRSGGVELLQDAIEDLRWA